MNTSGHEIKVGSLSVRIVRKAIKNLHLGVYPPNGRVRVAAPLAVSDEAVRLAVIGKLSWIKRQRERFLNQPRQSKREMVGGETHYFLGRRYRLRVVASDGPANVHCRKSGLDLHIRSSASVGQREWALQEWYRQQLKDLIPSLLEKWECTVGIRAAEWGVKKMKTKWGSCNISARRIWLNLELAKRPVQCLEYILVHELVHILERHHSDRFKAHMDEFLPHWRVYRDELNRAPLGHEEWKY